MKYSFLLLLCLSTWSAAVTAADFYKVEPGLLHLDGRSFNFNVWVDRWSGGAQLNRKTLTALPGYPERKAGSADFLYRGKFQLPKTTGICQFRFESLSPDCFRLDTRLSFPAQVQVDYFCCGTIFSNEFWKKTPVLFNGKPRFFQSGEKQCTIPDVNEIRIPAKTGTLVITGKFNVMLVDISQSSYAPDSLQMRIAPIPANGVTQELNLQLRVEFIPEQARPLDLRAAMNMGFRDDLAEDRKGGWTDQGAANDLRALAPGARAMDNVFFRVEAPEANRGNSCIALRGEARKYFPATAEAAFSDAPRGHYLYLLHATAWDAPEGTEVGKIRCFYADGSEDALTVKSKIHVANFWKAPPLPEASIGWRGDNDVAALGLYITRFPVKNAPLQKIRFESAGTSVWMVVAASLSDKKITGAAPRPKVLAADNDEWLPLNGDLAIVPGSILDRSGQLDAPAGKYGFARNRDGKIVFEKNDRPMRFYGANLCFSANYMKSKKDIDRMADDFARMGYNIVRFHHFDRDLTDHRGADGAVLKPELLDRFDYTLAAFKKRGIYVTMDLFISRDIRPNRIAGYPKGMDRGSYKALVWADENCRDNFLLFAKRLLGHVNAYTGVAWQEEPAIINIDLVNEDAVSWTSRTKFAAPVYEQHFAKFVSQNKLSFSDYERDRYWKWFLSEFYPQSYRKTTAALRKQGVRQMFCDQNHGTDILGMLTREPYDLVENHMYWAHPAFLNNSWGLPALIQGGSAIAKFGGSMTDMFKTRAIGKPFSMTEWDFVTPNRYNVEGAFLMGAYGALQDWNAFCRFAYAHQEKTIVDPGSAPEFFDIVRDPARRLSELAGVLFFLRGDIAPSQVTVPLLLNPRHFAAADAPGGTGIVPERLGLIAKTGNLVMNPAEPPQKRPRMNAAIYADRSMAEWAKGKLPAVASDDHLGAIPALEKAGVLPVGSEDYANGIYRSTTRELEMDVKRLTFKAVSPRSEGFLLDTGTSLAGKFASVANRRNFCAVLCAAMDDRPLADSGRYLLLHLTDTKNTGMTFSDEEMRILEKHGKMPVLIRRGVAELTLKRDLTGYRLYPLALNGKRLSPVPFRVVGGQTIVALDTARALAWELVKE